MDDSRQNDWISAAEVANYVVCPEAWRLKQIGAGERVENQRSAESQEIRAEWVRKQDLSSQLRHYAKIAYVLLVLLTMLVFIFESRRSDYFEPILKQQAAGSGVEVPTEILSLLLTLGLVIFMWDLFERRSRSLQTASGLVRKAVTVAVKGSSELPAKQFSSNELRLRSKPDALIRENQQLIPIDVHPLTNKIRDRHVVQLLVHLRLIEATEGYRPEHGILLMGKAQRKVLIKNTPEKQRWLETLVDEMRSIMDGVPAVASPAPFKCRTCDVRTICRFSAWKDGSSRSGEPTPSPEEGQDDDHEDYSQR